MSWDLFEKKKYVEIKKGEWRCRVCNAIILAKNNYGFASDEFGRPYFESSIISQEPFCPKCDECPNLHAGFAECIECHTYPRMP